MKLSPNGVLCCAALLAAPMVFGLQEAQFFRVLSPTNSAITKLHLAGWLAWTNAASDGITCTVQRASELAGSGNWADYVQHAATNATVALRLFDPAPPAGMTLIPAGCFQMGDDVDNTEAEAGEAPVHTVYVSAFYMDTAEITWTKWQEVRAWATDNGYDLEEVGEGKADGHPVYNVNWYDCVKWCNARSQMEGRGPSYTRQGNAYKTGEHDDILCNTATNGYRLPTEAEWEKAARGGPSGVRFAWGGAISHTEANYNALPSSYAYDTNSVDGYHPGFNTGAEPYTSPVASFAQNGYGLYGIAGNVCEWCWDWFDETYYEGSPASDPAGPETGTYHSLRGGSWYYDANNCRSASRGYDDPTLRDINYGFRTVLRPGP